MPPGLRAAIITDDGDFRFPFRPYIWPFEYRCRPSILATQPFIDHPTCPEERLQLACSYFTRDRSLQAIRTGAPLVVRISRTGGDG